MIKRAWLALERYFLFHLLELLRIRGESEKVARGFSLGMIVNFFPTFGFGVLIGGFFARAFGGNAVAGVVGGALLTFFWPVLFFLNMKTGRYFIRPPVIIDELADVTETTIDALVWGHTFLAGALANSLLVGGSVYGLMRLLYRRLRPPTLAYFRRHARDHQKRVRWPSGSR
jgi:uncharacterized protein (DUF2062 family)